jgi:hypothetical protein
MRFSVTNLATQLPDDAFHIAIRGIKVIAAAKDTQERHEEKQYAPQDVQWREYTGQGDVVLVVQILLGKNVASAS